jgi:hypothetical protein
MIVEFVLAAEHEFNDALAYLDQKSSGLGAEFARDVEQAVQRIIENPLAWRMLPGGMRRCRLRRFE